MLLLLLLQGRNNHSWRCNSVIYEENSCSAKKSATRISGRGKKAVFYQSSVSCLHRCLLSHTWATHRKVILSLSPKEDLKINSPNKPGKPSTEVPKIGAEEREEADLWPSAAWWHSWQRSAHWASLTFLIRWPLTEQSQLEGYND